jgi:hypothetical protein
MEQVNSLRKTSELPEFFYPVPSRFLWNCVIRTIMRAVEAIPFTLFLVKAYRPPLLRNTR